MRRARSYKIVCLSVIAIVALMASFLVQAEPVHTEVKQSDKGWQLIRDGKPYDLKGAGGDWHLASDGGRRDLERLAKAGGNSIRTWGVGEETEQLLDLAHELGLTVTLGLWLGHERHGFNYNDLDQVAEQKEKVRQAVLKFKDHPAVLAWGVGNEMEGYEAGDNAAIWSHVEAVAAMIKRLDPNHPTMTVIAEIGGRKLESIQKLCPSIDIVGINSYGGAASLPERYGNAHITKPYIVTEFGPPGTWEVGANIFGAPEELTSTQKAPIYAKVYSALKADHKNCLGSYVFLWGAKVEATTTWFGMFLKDGSKVAAVDAMTLAWTGKLPEDLSPAIESIAILEDYETQPGAQVKISLKAKDPEGKALDVQWKLLAESSEYFTGGDKMDEPPSFPKLITSASEQHCTLTLPDKPGIYRVYAIVKDPAGHAAVANVPLYAGKPGEKIEKAEVKPGQSVGLPFAVYTDADDKQPWTPSGYMGNAEQIKLELDHAQNVHAGKTCIKAQYLAPGDWAGVVWQDPVNDWGDEDGGFDVSGAKALEFWARGDAGGEVVNFGFGVLGADKKHPDSGSGELKDVRLTNEWKKYRIELGEDVDLKRIKTGFFWSLAGIGKPITFYLDDIRYVAEAEK